MTEFMDLGRSLALNLGYLKWGGKGLRWPLMDHSPVLFPHHIEMVENELLTTVKVSTLARFLAQKKREYILVVEVRGGHYWVNVYRPVRANDPGPAHCKCYDERRGKNGTFTYIVTKEGTVSKPRRLAGVFWINQSPLMSVKTPLNRNAREFLNNILREGGEDHD